MNKIKILAIVGKSGAGKDYILKCDRIVIPFYYTDELIPWGDGYHVISKNELGDLPWNFGQNHHEVPLVIPG